jgi:hypothetical protein
MGGIPNESTCSICEFVRTKPPNRKHAKPGEKSLSHMGEVTSAWCSLHGRGLLVHPYAFPDPNPEPTISSTVCSKFTSGYLLADGQSRWPHAQAGDEEHLWENRPTKSPPYWANRPFVRLDELPRVNPESGEIQDAL